MEVICIKLKGSIIITTLTINKIPNLVLRAYPSTPILVFPILHYSLS